MGKLYGSSGWSVFLKIQLSLSEKKNISRPAYAGLETRSKAGARVLIFISTEPVYMNNKLPRRGGEP